MSAPFDLYLQCRELVGKQSLPHHPFFHLYQPLLALRALQDAKQEAKSAAPLITETGRAPLCPETLWPRGSFPMVGASCQLALLWAKLGKKNNDPAFLNAANRLAGFLEPLVEENLTTLWTLEKEYQEDPHSCQLFLQAIGKSNDLVNDPFFDSSITLQPKEPCFKDPSIGYELRRSEIGSLAITASGHQTMAGACRIGDIEIPAFGPHSAPLSNSDGFGIGPGEDGWFCSWAAKDVWFKLRGEIDLQGLSLSVDSAGVSADKPIAFVFYVRAKECAVGAKILQPKSLARIATEDSVAFRNGSSKVVFSCTPSHKIEVIPLAGENAFWGASFLLAVWLPSFHATTSFCFSLNR